MTKDKVLNRYYTQIAKVYEEEPENLDKMMGILDKIYSRREKLGEI